MQKIYRRTRMPKSDFKNVAQQQLGLETRIFNGLKLQLFWYHSQNIIKPIHATDLFWYPLKTYLWFSDVFRGYQKRLLAWNGLRFEICSIYPGVDQIPVEDRNRMWFTAGRLQNGSFI